MSTLLRRFPGRWPARRPLFVGALMALALLIAVFDWTWFRPLIQHFVLERSGRAIRFDKLRIGVTSAGEPSVEFRGLHVENAAWAAPRPLIEAGLVRLVFSWHSLTGANVIVTRLVLVDARVDLERSADDLRNWRLSKPLDRGPSRIRVLLLDATRSELRFADQRMAFEVDTRIAALATRQVLAAAPDRPLSKWFTFKGRHGGAVFEGEAGVSDVFSFADTGLPFALRGEARSGAARLQFEGLAADALHLERLDVDLHLASPHLDALQALLPAQRWPALPVDATAHLSKRGSRSSFSGVQARLGRSDAQGALRLDARDATRARPMLQADLRSASVDVGEIAAAFARASASGGGLKGLQALDADIEWQATRLVRPATAWLQGLSLAAALRDGRLDVERFDLGIAGGHATGTLKIDSTLTPPMLELNTRLAGLRTETVSTALAGALHGRATLRAHGDSAAAWLHTLAGSAHASLRGATISRQLDARLALDAGAMLRTLFAADAKVAVQCATLAVEFDHGRGRARHIAFETERVTVNGGGTLDLTGRSLDLLLTPRRKNVALLALDRSIHVSGPLQAPQVALAERREGTRGALASTQACVDRRD